MNRTAAAEKRRKKTRVGKLGPFFRSRATKQAAQSFGRFVRLLWLLLRIFSTRKNINSHGKA
nr:MAG TPA: hypothetical protein [Caudoviricetes sp.]